MKSAEKLRAWLSGITGPCQGPVGVSITPARTKVKLLCVVETAEAGTSRPRLVAKCVREVMLLLRKTLSTFSAKGVPNL